MHIIAHLKKQPKWQVQFNDDGSLNTGMQYGHIGQKNHEIKVPIFEAKLQYHTHYQGTRSIVVQFKGCDEDSLIAILKGKGPCVYDMDKDDGFAMMEHLIRKDDPKFEYFEDGWFTGVFTFKKKGNRVFITPYTGDITKEVKA